VTERYDVIIIGTGAGGGTLAHTLAPSGKKILLLERGDFLPREMDNWNPKPVFVDGKYITHDTWYDADGKPFQPQVHYYLGGATKMCCPGRGGAPVRDLPVRHRPGHLGARRELQGPRAGQLVRGGHQLFPTSGR
jgi:choline dehydrogenase-like flavoprotein